ncbi:MAG: PKD domain-containing protein [Thermoplasmata archaeon]|nr:PKD domain-containing protein [Thermoplasmata archaeon]
MKAAWLPAIILAAMFMLAAFPVLDSPETVQALPTPPVEQADLPELAMGLMDGIFTQNLGQTSDVVRYYAGGGGAAFGNSSVFIYTTEETTGRSNVLRLTFRGANTVEPKGIDPAPWKSNFLRGGDSQNWQLAVPNYRGLVYENLWEGVDLFYGMAGQSLKYSFKVEPYADLSQIVIDVEGHDGISADGDALTIGTGLGPGSEITDSGLNVYYQDDSTQLEARFVKAGNDSYTFEVPIRDPARALVIDPLVYSTYLGGKGSECGTGIALDSGENAYVTGYTDSEDFITVPGNFESLSREHHDVFISKLDRNGGSLEYSSFIGGSEYDMAASIAVDDGGCAHVTGVTYSSDFPTTMGAFDQSYNGTGDGFAVKLSGDGSSLLYSTFLGGKHDDRGNSIALDSDGQAYIAGETWSADFPATPGAYSTVHNGDSDAFALKISINGNLLIYSTFLGSAGSDYGQAIAVRDRYAYVAGTSSSATFPVTSGKLNRTNIPGDDVFVVKLGRYGDSLNYSAFFGGRGAERINGIALDSYGNAYVAGVTNSTDFPITARTYDRTLGGERDGFVTKLNASGAQLDYSTFIGGSENESVAGIALDPDGRVYITGSTDSEDYPVTGAAFDLTINGKNDSFTTKFDPTGTWLEHSTFLGGSEDDLALGIAVTDTLCICIAGVTYSEDFPATSFGRIQYGEADVFTAKFDPIIPIADAGPDQSVNESNTVQFDATGSYDNVGIVNYTWSFNDGSENVTLFTPWPTYFFRIPGTYPVTLTVRDGVNNIVTDLLFITVLVYPYPVANAGTDIRAEQGSTVTFNGSLSRDNVHVTDYIWTFNDGTNAVAIIGQSPSWEFKVPGTYEAVLKVADADANTDEDRVNVTVADSANPTAEPGQPISVVSGEIAAFNASGSSDNVGIANYTWTFSYNGTDVSLFGQAATYRFLVPGTYAVTLSVTDGAGNNDTNILAVTVAEPDTAEDDSGALPLELLFFSAALTIFISAVLITLLRYRKRKPGSGNVSSDPEGGDGQ